MKHELTDKELEEIDSWFGQGHRKFPNITDVFKRPSLEERDKMYGKKFKGKFQEACQGHYNNWYMRASWRMDYGWSHQRHCFCSVCAKRCKEEGLKQCTDNNCDGCKRKREKRKLPLAIRIARGPLF